MFQIKITIANNIHFAEEISIDFLRSQKNLCYGSKN